MKKRKKKEIEHTYMIKENNFGKIIDIINNFRNIYIKDKQFILEKGEVGQNLYFLPSDNFAGTRTMDGKRYRIKYNLVSEKFTYTEKEFINGERIESHEYLGNSVSKALNKFQKMPIIDALMFKYSIKYRFINYISDESIRICVDYSYPIDPSELNVCNEFYSYIEIEEEKGHILEEFEAGVLFQELSPYIDNMPDYSHNRLRKCLQCFPGQTIVFSNKKGFKSAMRKIRDNLRDIQKKNYDLYEKGNIMLRGNKERERSDDLEVEYKISNINSITTLLDVVQQCIGNKYDFVKTVPRIITDVYMDNEGLELYNNSASFRIRRRKKGKGWISCFKSVKGEYENLQRYKTRTELSNEDVKNLIEKEIQGNAPKKLYNFLEMEQRIEPKILILEYRERFVVRCKSSNIEKYYKSDDDTYFALQRKEIVHVIVDTVFAYDLRGCSKKVIEHLIKFGELVVEKTVPCVQFSSVEIEPNHRYDVADISKDVFYNICKQLEGMGIYSDYKSKYQIGMELLSDNKKKVGS